jgi:hypothetical protein
MRPQYMTSTVAFALFAPLAAVMAQASAEPITRSNWVPEVGELVGSVFPPNEFERPLETCGRSIAPEGEQ